MSAAPSDWTRVRLGSLCSIKHGFPFKSEFFSDEPGEVVLTPGNFAPTGGLVLRPEKDRSYAGPYPSEYRLMPGELLVVMTDLTQEARILGAPAFVPPEPVCLHNQRLGKIVDVDVTRVDLRFLYYVFNAPTYRAELKATASGSTVKHTSPGRIAAHEVDLPPLPTQRRIAAILGAYDDLIEVNRRRIAVLEEMARRLFEEWFVAFRFPGHDTTPLQDTPHGPLPQGWRWAPFGEIGRNVREAVDPADVPADTPYVGLEHIPRRATTLTDWGRASDVTSTKLRFRKGDVLFGKIRPYFHKVAWAPFEGVCSSDAIVVRPTSTRFSAIALSVASSDAFVAHSVQTSNGTKMPRANWDVLAQYRVAVPETELLHVFNNAAMPGVELAAVLHQSSQRLAAARDLLLPRLISGELTVADAERTLETAA
jgi:type I restriction enzyme S subunit